MSIRLKTAEKQYMDAFDDELSSFIDRVKTRAKVRLEEATRIAEEVSGGREAMCGTCIYFTASHTLTHTHTHTLTRKHFANGHTHTSNVLCRKRGRSVLDQEG